MPRQKSRKAASRRKPGRPRAGKAAGDGAGRWSGQSVVRKEEARHIRGLGRFVDDFHLGDMAYVSLVRSPYGHARIEKIDVSQAERAPGVLCVLTGRDVAGMMQPFLEIGPEPGGKIVDYPMGIDKVHFQGEPVAAVVADSRMGAEDAAELVQVDYDMLDAVIDAEDALRDRSIVHDSAGTNVVWRGVFEYGDVQKAFRNAAHVVEIDKLHFHRFSSTPLENNAVIAQWHLGDSTIQFWTNNSFPAFAIQFLAMALGINIDQMRVQTHDIGGSFGIKITNYPYMAIAALASRKLNGRPVKWVETRSEHLTASAHGNERTFLDTRVALDKDGVVTAIESRHIDDCGAYPRYEPLGCVIWAQVLPGVYRFRNLRVDFTQVVTNKCPVGPNRGYSRMQHLWFLERVVDICGHKLGIPPDQMRLRNYIRPQEFPYTTPNGCVYDSGNYAKMLEIAQKQIGWKDWLKKKEQARAQGRLLGIGIGTTLDSGTNNFGQSRIINPNAPYSGQSEGANVKLDIDGRIVVSLGSVPQGQGHETTAAQVVADVLNVTPDMVDVRPGFDTERNVHTGHSGTYASQFAVTGLSAVHGAAVKLRSEIKKLAAFVLKAKENKLELGVGKMGPEVRIKGTDKSINYWGLANLVNVNNATLPDDLDITLNCRHIYRPPFELPDIKRKYGNLTLTYASQLHIAVVEVDPVSYQPRLVDYAVVDDCGRVVNPAIVKGQVHGATAHGIGAALLENCRYDETGNMLTSTFSDYVPVTTMNIPLFRCSDIESPSPFTFNGAKGMGEGGGTPLHAISAALQDALYDQGIMILDSHNNAGSVFEALEQARAGRGGEAVRLESRRAAAAR